MSEPLTRIAVIGKMHSGKTTFANHLVAMGFERIALADTLKDDVMYCLNYLMESYGLNDRIDRDIIERDKLVFRPFLQWLGTEFFRDYLDRPTHWIDEFRRRVRVIEQGTKMGLPDLPLVCDDVRFPNEADALREMGFTLIKVVRPEDHRKRSVWKQLVEEGVPTPEIERRMADIFSHSTETLVDGLEPDIVIENIGVNTLLEEARRLSGRNETQAQRNERILRQVHEIMDASNSANVWDSLDRIKTALNGLTFNDDDLSEFKRKLP